MLYRKTLQRENIFGSGNHRDFGKSRGTTEADSRFLLHAARATAGANPSNRNALLVAEKINEKESNVGIGSRKGKKFNSTNLLG